MKNRTIFVACDTSDIKIIKKIISQTRSRKLKIIPKFGLQFFYSKQGRKFLEKIKKNLKILGVTVLTSLNNKSLKQIGHTKEVKKLVLKQADLLKKSNCDGIVCSAQEAKVVWKKYKNLLIITPGIRLPGDSSNDQMRVMTPEDAFRNNVSGIVMGRSITKGNIKDNINRLLDHLNK